MTAFEKAYNGIVRSTLQDDTLQNIADFGAAHDTFIDLYRTLPDAKVQPSRNHYLHSPQIHTFLYEVPLWIIKNGCTLARESEQAGEAQHKQVKKAMARYMIQPTRAFPAKPPKKRLEPSSSSSSPSPAAALKPSVDLGISSSSTLNAARTKVMRAFITYNDSCLEPSFLCSARMARATSLFKKMGAPPHAPYSCGRGGDSFAEMIKEWRSNDAPSVQFLINIINFFFTHHKKTTLRILPH